MKMKGNFKVKQIIRHPNCDREDVTVGMEIKFKDASITYTRIIDVERNPESSRLAIQDNYYSFIARDKKMLGRLQTFAKSDLFRKVFAGELGLEGKIEFECR